MKYSNNNDNNNSSIILTSSPEIGRETSNFCWKISSTNENQNSL